MSTWKVWRVVVLCVMVTGAIVPGRAQTARSKPVNEALTVNGDGAQRSKDIHWPDGFHPEQADLFAHNEIVVHASCEKVFANIVDAQAWPSWYPNSHNVKLLNSPDGKLHEGARFSWDTFGVHIESRVHEFVPGSRIGWFGDGTGMNAYHTFLPFFTARERAALAWTEALTLITEGHVPDDICELAKRSFSLSHFPYLSIPSISELV